MTHILLDAEWDDESTTNVLQSEEATRKMLDNLCDLHHFTILNRVFHFFSPQGMTCLYLLAESHLSIHTWPEHKSCSIDLFCCRDLGKSKVREIVSMLTSELDLVRIKCSIHDRSFVFE